MSDGIITPEAEVWIEILGREVVIISLFRNEDGSTDVLCGMEDTGSLDMAATILSDASFALRAAFGLSHARRADGDVPGVETGEAQHPF